MTRPHQESTLALDASELVWSGALDNAAPLDDCPWKELGEWSADLFDRRHAPEALRVASARAKALATDRVVLELAFEVLDSQVEGRIGMRWTQPLLLVAVPCHFGGARWWFECPGVDCGARRSKLYRPGVSWWACRECYGLTYASRARYSARTQHSDGWGSLNRFLDLQDARCSRADRSSMRRRVSRWRKEARGDSRRGTWPVQVTCEAPSPEHPSR